MNDDESAGKNMEAEGAAMAEWTRIFSVRRRMLVTLLQLDMLKPNTFLTGLNTLHMSSFPSAE